MNHKSSLNIGPFEVTAYYGETDGKPVVQIDGSGDLRVNVNDAPVFDRHTEENGRDVNGNVNATVTDVALAIKGTDFDPARVLAQVMSAFGPSAEAADLVDELGSILAGIHGAANLPSLDPDDPESVHFWDAVADTGGVSHRDHSHDWDD